MVGFMHALDLFLLAGGFFSCVFAGLYGESLSRTVPSTSACYPPCLYFAKPAYLLPTLAERYCAVDRYAGSFTKGYRDNTHS